MILQTTQAELRDALSQVAASMRGDQQGILSLVGDAVELIDAAEKQASGGNLTGWQRETVADVRHTRQCLVDEVFERLEEVPADYGQGSAVELREDTLTVDWPDAEFIPRRITITVPFGVRMVGVECVAQTISLAEANGDCEVLYQLEIVD